MSRPGAQGSSTRGALQAALQIVLVLVLLATLQFLAGRHNVRFDMSPNKRFMLSPYARQAAEGFKQSGMLYAFYDSQQVVDRRRMLDLLDQFKSYAPGLQYELVDLDRNPGLSKKYGVSRYNTGVLELENGDRIPIRSVSEESLTATLLRLGRGERRQVCFVTGHGEGSPSDSNERSGYTRLSSAIEREGLAVTKVSTLRSGVPDDCTILMFVAPTHELAPGEADTIESYVRDGGRALLLVDPGSPESFDELVSRFGIAAGTNIIVDEQNRMLGADSFVPQVDRFRQEIFRDRLGASVILPVARTIRATAERPEGIRVISLAGTSDSSWARAESTEVPAQDVQFRPQLDEPGPLSIAVQAIVKTAPDQAPGEIVVIGDSDLASNRHIDTLGNRDFTLALIGLLAEDQTLIGTRQQSEADPERPLSLNAAQTRTIFYLAVVILPGLSALAGFGLAFARRRQRGGR